MASKQKPTGRDLVAGFGQAVRKAREEAGLTLAQVAERAGTTTAGVSKVELEVRAPSLRLAVALAEAIGVGIADLLTEAKQFSMKATRPGGSKANRKVGGRR